MRLLFIIIALALAAWPFVAHASDQDVVVVTAQPGGNMTCPQDMAINVVSAYEIEFTWMPATGNYTTGSVIKAAYGRYLTDSSDGFVVYEGEGNETTHWVNTEFIDVDVYYAIWATYGNDTYSECYLSGSVTGGIGMAELASNVELGIILFIPGLLILLSFWRRNIVAYIAAIISIGLTLPEVQSSLGTYVLAPMIVIMIGIALMALYDATIGKGIRV